MVSLAELLAPAPSHSELDETEKKVSGHLGSHTSHLESLHHFHYPTSARCVCQRTKRTTTTSAHKYPSTPTCTTIPVDVYRNGVDEETCCQQASPPPRLPSILPYNHSRRDSILICSVCCVVVVREHILFIYNACTIVLK